MQDEFETIRLIGRMMNSVADLDSLLRMLLDGAVSLVGARRGFIVLVEEDGGRVVRVARGVTREDLPQFDVSSTVIDQVLANAEPRLVVDAGGESDLKDSDSVRMFDLRSILCVPITYQDKVRGALYLDNDQKKGAFTSDDLDFASALADQASTALAHGAMEAEKKAIAQELEQRRLMEEAVRREAEALARNNRLLEQFARGLSHDLKEPLRTLTTAGRLLAERLPADDPQLARLVDIVRSSTERMDLLVSDLLAYASVQASRDLAGPVDLGVAAEQALANLERVVQESGAEVTVGSLPKVLGRQGQMIQLFQNLFSNALKFCHETPRIVVGSRPADGGWEISVWDNGIGMEAEFRDEIFKPFRRLHTREEYPGTGIGLALCHEIMELHRGRIWVDSTPGEGSGFFLFFPESG